MALLCQANLTVDAAVVTGPLPEFQVFLATSDFTPEQEVILKAVRKKVGNRLAQRRRTAKVAKVIQDLKDKTTAAKDRLAEARKEEANVIIEEETLKLMKVSYQPCTTENYFYEKKFMLWYQYCTHFNTKYCVMSASRENSRSVH